MGTALHRLHLDIGNNVQLGLDAKGTSYLVWHNDLLVSIVVAACGVWRVSGPARSRYNCNTAPHAPLTKHYVTCETMDNKLTNYFVGFAVR